MTRMTCSLEEDVRVSLLSVCKPQVCALSAGALGEMNDAEVLHGLRWDSGPRAIILATELGGRRTGSHT